MTRLFEMDFDELEDGAHYETPARTLGESDIASFAQLTGDFHPQHVDAVWAEQSPFGGRIAHGLLVLSWAAGLVPFDPTRVVALRAVRDVVFKRPAFPGDTLHVEGKIESRTPIDEKLGLVTTTWRIVNQRGSGVARARVEVLWRREGAASEPRETDIVGAGVLPL